MPSENRDKWEGLPLTLPQYSDGELIAAGVQLYPRPYLTNVPEVA